MACLLLEGKINFELKQVQYFLKVAKLYPDF